jgi:hypothetical protein
MSEVTCKTSVRRGCLLATAAVALGLAGATPAAGLPRILEPRSGQSLPDFSYAGYGFGLAPPPEGEGQVVSVTDHGAIANDERDDSRAILAALDAANKVEGPVRLRFPAGRFIVSEILWISRSNIVIEGAGRGAGGTELVFPRPLRLVDKTKVLDRLRAYLRKNDKQQVDRARNIDLPFSEYSWTGGFIWSRKPEGSPAPATLSGISAGRRGDRELRTSSATNLRKGDIVTVTWRPDKGPDSGIIAAIYGPGVKAGSSHWTSPQQALVVQTTRVEAANGTRVRIADPLLHDISPTIPADLGRWGGLTNVGIRDLAIVFPEGASFGHHLEEGYNGIHLNDVFDGWISGLRISNADSGILTDNSASVTISDIVTEGEREAHYAVHLGSVHNVLVSDLLIANPVIHSLTFNTGSTRSVYRRATVLRRPTLDQHAGANHQNLFDNVTLHIAARRREGGPSYPLWDGSGAAYWQPGHGRFNTSWNVRVMVQSGALPGEKVLLTGLDEGPDARIVGVSGNRPFTVDYRPTPHVERLNDTMADVPSLYDFQLDRRRATMRGSR